MWVADVPALGAIRLTVVPAGRLARRRVPVRVDVRRRSTTARCGSRSIRDTGDIRSLTVARALAARELVRRGAGLNAYLYVPGTRSGARPSGAGAPDDHARGRAARSSRRSRIASDGPRRPRLVRRVSLVAEPDAVDLETVLDKTLVREKESAHLAFPLERARRRDSRRPGRGRS